MTKTQLFTIYSNWLTMTKQTKINNKFLDNPYEQYIDWDESVVYGRFENCLLSRCHNMEELKERFRISMTKVFPCCVSSNDSEAQTDEHGESKDTSDSNSDNEKHEIKVDDTPSFMKKTKPTPSKPFWKDVLCCFLKMSVCNDKVVPIQSF